MSTVNDAIQRQENAILNCARILSELIDATKLSNSREQLITIISEYYGEDYNIGAEIVKNAEDALAEWYNANNAILEQASAFLKQGD